VERAARDAAGSQDVDRVNIDRADEPIVVPGDAEQLEQVVRNLVDNALKYGSPEALVEVRVSRGERDMAVIEVRDQGEGIPAEHLPHLTRRFYRTDPGRSRGAGGTGLGRAIVKHIVERHRGRLDIASKLGEGTTITIRLPIAPGDEES
jgi:two-component system phosphate regulon sensor histidine kinase PhoR